MLGDQSDQVVKEFALRPFRQLVLFGQACGELGKRNRKLVSHLFPLQAVEELSRVRKRRTDDLEMAERYREQLSVFYDAPCTKTGEALGDAVAELYKVTGWWLRNFRDRPAYKQQALRSEELIIGLLDA
jgi:hypothetical protein